MSKIWNKIKNWLLGCDDVCDSSCVCEQSCCCTDEKAAECECVDCPCGTEEAAEDDAVEDSSIKCVGLEVSAGDPPIEKQFVDLQDASRKLAFLLRHDKDYDFPSNGFRTIENLVTECGYTVEEIDEIVATDEKGRYEFNDDRTAVRACQGHSVLVDVGLKETVPPMFLYHGTSDKSLASIMEHGIQKQSRLYVHLSKTEAEARKVGARHGGKTVVLRILAHDMYEDGFKFLLSENNVWCIDEVPSFPCQYIEVMND